MLRHRIVHIVEINPGVFGLGVILRGPNEQVGQFGRLGRAEVSPPLILDHRTITISGRLRRAAFGLATEHLVGGLVAAQQHIACIGAGHPALRIAQQWEILVVQHCQ